MMDEILTLFNVGSPECEDNDICPNNSIHTLPKQQNIHIH